MTLAVFSSYRFWSRQFGGLFRWVGAFVTASWIEKGKSNFFKKHSDNSKLLILIIPGVGGGYIQFYWLIRSLVQNCRGDLLYIQPEWGQVLEKNRNDILVTLMSLDLSQYEQCIAIGHSRGGLLAKSILDALEIQDRVLCTLATPWRSPEYNLGKNAGMRGWVERKKYNNYLSHLFRWSKAGTAELFQTYSLPTYKTLAFASEDDPILGDVYYQSPSEQSLINMIATHSSLPLEHTLIHYLTDFIKKHAENKY